MKKKLQEQYQKVLQEIKAIEESDTPDTEKYLALIQDAENLQKQIEAAEKAEGLRSWAGELDLAKSVTFDETEKAGTELVQLGPNGQRHSLDAEGWGIDSKTWKAISEPGYKSAWLRYVRGKADDQDIKALAEGSDPAGGFLVPPDVVNRIIMRKPHPTRILGNITTMTTSRDKVMMPKFKYTADDIYSSGVRIAWTGETGPSAPDTSLENWGMKEIDVHTGSFEIEAYRDMVEDAAFDIEALISKEGRNAYDLGLDNIVINGTGVGQPAGMLRNVGAADEPPSLNVGNPVTADNLKALVLGLPPQYDENAKFLVNRTNVFATLSQLKDSANNYIFGLMQNIDGGLARPHIEQLLGHEILFSAFMPNGGAAANIGIYADFMELYTLVQRLGMSMEPIGLGDRELRRANKVAWYFRFRVGGAVVQDRAGRVAVQS